MASITGRAVTNFSVGGNDLKGDLLETFTYNKGRRMSNRTRGGDVATRYVPVKRDPSIEATFDPDVAASRAYVQLMADQADQADDNAVALDVKITADGTTGVHVAGMCVVEEPRLVINNENGEASLQVTLRPNGTAWTTDADVS